MFDKRNLEGWATQSSLRQITSTTNRSDCSSATTSAFRRILANDNSLRPIEGAAPASLHARKYLGNGYRSTASSYLATKLATAWFGSRKFRRNPASRMPSPAWSSSDDISLRK